MAVQGPTQAITGVTAIDVGGRGAVAAGRRELPVMQVLPVPAAPERRPAASAEDIRALQAKIAAQLQQYLKESGRDVEFRVDSGANATVITVKRADTGEVVRQFPTEEALAWMRRLNEQSGTFLDELA